MEDTSRSENAAYCDAIRRRIEHEDSLVVNRLSWLMASQAFLFTAYAIVLNGPVIPRNEIFSVRQDLLMLIIPLLGLACCTLIYAGVLGAAVVMAGLRSDIEARHKGSGTQEPPIQGTAMTRTLGMVAPLLLPPIFCVAWIFLMRC